MISEKKGTFYHTLQGMMKHRSPNTKQPGTVRLLQTVHYKLPTRIGTSPIQTGK